MKIVTPNAILNYYDGIQIFTASDEIGGQYIGTMVGTEGDYGRYLVAGVSPSNLDLFRCGEIDLRALLLSSPTYERFTTVASGKFLDPLSLTTVEEPLERSPLLPEAGVFLEEEPRQDTLTDALFEDKPTTTSWLQDSLADLEEALENAANSGIPKPAPTTVAEARRVLEKIHKAAPRIYLVYLMPNGAIAIDTRGVKPDGAFITLDDDGAAYCSGEIDGKHWHKKYAKSQDLPDRPLLGELKKLGWNLPP